MSIKQYNHLAEDYSKLIIQDPLKKYLQYPEAIRLLGDIHGKLILDIGCGDGYFTSIIAEKGAKIIGYDSSERQIELAKARENKNMKFFCSDQNKFDYHEKFDKAVSNMVLFYAKNYSELVSFFNSAFKHLRNGGEFLAIIINPNFSRLGKIVYNRRILKISGRKMRTEFFINGKYSFSSDYSYFSKQDYKKAALKSGFKEIDWKELSVIPEGIKSMGEEFWEGYNKDPLYAAFIAKK
ncbi:class I SAM-dependent methyltransferase [Candidatus Pacearchaeota archaeon]|nr:class I SAM-dependent methyltransferase [Candidatus Pacearchaeota archaeon]